MPWGGVLFPFCHWPDPAAPRGVYCPSTGILSLGMYGDQGLKTFRFQVFSPPRRTSQAWEALGAHGAFPRLQQQGGNW